MQLHNLPGCDNLVPQLQHRVHKLPGSVRTNDAGCDNLFVLHDASLLIQFKLAVVQDGGGNFCVC